MAMRQRSGGISADIRRQSYRPIYEDFQPYFELKEENEAHIIHVHLPGFVKEQVRVRFEDSPGVIKVHGQRPLGNNKWSRFNQTFPVQENCVTSKIHGKFNNGILTVTIPKKVITQIGPKGAAAKPIREAPPTPSKTATSAAAKPQKVQEDDLISSKESLTTTVAQKQKDVTSLTTTTAGPQKTRSSEPKAQKDQEGTSQTTTTAAAAQDAPPSAGPQGAAAAEPKAQTAGDEIERDDKNGGHPLGLPKGIAETKAPKDKDEGLPKAFSAIHNEKQRDEKRVIPLTSPERGISEPKSQKSQDEIPPTRLINKKKAESAAESVDRKDRGEANGKGAETKNAEKVVESTLHKERETDERRKDAKAVPKILARAKEKSKRFGSAVDQKKPKEEDSIVANVMAAAKQGMQNLQTKRINDEEKQMLINMGAAVLVLLALGASAFWSSAKSKN